MHPNEVVLVRRNEQGELETTPAYDCFVDKAVSSARHSEALTAQFTRQQQELMKN